MPRMPASVQASVLMRRFSVTLGRPVVSSPAECVHRQSQEGMLRSRKFIETNPPVVPFRSLCTRHAFLNDTDKVRLSCGSEVTVDSTLGYRRNVAVVVFNADGNVLSCRRYFRDGVESSNSEPPNWNENWQFPQGGIDEGEDPLPAAFRELAEETSITAVELVAESSKWLTYDFDARTKATLGARMDRYRGQKQKYYLMRFLGTDADINFDVPGHSKEFDAFKWVRIEKVASRVVGFKQDVYAQVAAEFAPIIKRELSADRS